MSSGHRFDANVSILFPGVPALGRPSAAAAAGFDAIEMWWPFASEAPADAEINALAAAVSEAGVRVVLLNLPTGNADAGEHGFVALPRERSRFRAHVEVAAEVAHRLGVSIVNGKLPDTNCCASCSMGSIRGSSIPIASA